MSSSAPSHPSPTSPNPAKARRARSLPNARPYRIAVFFSSLHYLGLIATVTALVFVLIQPSLVAMRTVVGGILFCALTWLIAFFKRRGACCPLCKGTPLINSGARAHIQARRIPPFNHGVSAILSIIAKQKFSCMYCGSYFDLLKPPSHLLRGTNEPVAPVKEQTH